ncbi:DUF3231 family protein [Ureibacillus sp. Re31]|uniref:DUF3231 family protein n=1 Tax=Ureibacillus galli TaxID=2762222 RepID=A0ABR8XFP9_9BACL|nr:DUF3231 family protein [Ureibacillus galli]MBD8028055.1 DUF3231 family protein [Ureibacillus galli]
MTKHQTLLTSSEIGSIWTNFMYDSMSECILGYFLKDVKDEEIRPIVQLAYDNSAAHIEKLTSLFQREEIPTPTGFTSNDVNMNAPRMYTDTFMLTYINHMAKVGMLQYSGFISMSAREDVRNYFTDSLTDTVQLFEQSSKVLLSKGIFVRAPYIPYPTTKDFIDNKKYLSGLNPLSQKRPLNVVEISHLFMNIQTNLLGSKLALSFAQASAEEKIQKWMLKGRDISKKHIQIFTKTLLENDVQAPSPSDVAITDSTIPPFSDKLTMYHMSLLSAAGIGNYATAAAASQRSDLILNYNRFSLEIAQYTKDGADIVIEHGWLEQPPGTTDKKKLARNKETTD